jgi:dTDP-4-amino-4,6-dideoxygalactose transaminase
VKIPISKPLFGEEEMAAVQRPLETGWVVQGPFVRDFETAFSRFIDVPHAAAASSCTTALHLALAALHVKPGDEVIVPAFTWISTANVVEYFGAKPVFCDVDLATFNVDARAVAAAVTSRTVGILPVHLFGLCADMDPILDVARRHHLWVVEDAACAFGAAYRGRHAGGFGEAGCFSFHPRKSITTGEGGMVTTRDPALDRLVRSLRDHGAVQSDYARHHNRAAFLLSDYPHLGFNFRMTDLQGALGCAQMARAAWILDRRRACAAGYAERLAGHERLALPAVPDGFVHGYQAFVCLFGGSDPVAADDVPRRHERRNALMASLEERGIATRQGTHAAALQRYYVDRYGYRPDDFPNAWRAQQLSLTLPLYPQMSEADLDAVCDALLAEVARA